MSMQAHMPSQAAASWDQHFDEQRDIKLVDPTQESKTTDPGRMDSFRVYLAGMEHVAKGVFVLVHGAGQAALSFAVLTSLLKKHYAVVAYDMRGHGHTVTHSEELSNVLLEADTVNVIRAVLGDVEAKRKILLVGHSVGGAVVARVASSGKLAPSVVGCCLVDVCEGTAMAAMPRMKAILARKPQTLDTIQAGVMWTITSGILRSFISARVSIPPTLRLDSASGKYVFRTDLLPSEEHWNSWFQGLSATFLALPMNKTLIVADLSRLDTPLIAGDMQGKYQLKVAPKNMAGHFVHEDQPDFTAKTLLSLMARCV